ncbi:MAG: cell envelope integrity EipB family protein [Hyphomicrobium sp.]
MKFLGLPAAAILALLFPVSAYSADAVHFAPHRAVYDISLAKSASGSGVAGMTGRMVYELSGSACEGYTQNMRFVTRMSNQDGAETINDLRNSSWEEVAGKRLRFSTTQYANEDIVEASQGDVKRDAPSAASSVDLVKPAKSRFPLPANTFFPMQHAEALIKSAKSGQKIFSAIVYDGSEKGTKIYLTNAVIGKPEAPGARKDLASMKDGARLAALRSWPMSLSYFESGKDNQDVPPAYELSYHFYENGVTSDLAIDYGEFAIKGEMKELTFLPESPCAASEH